MVSMDAIILFKLNAFRFKALGNIMDLEVLMAPKHLLLHQHRHLLKQIKDRLMTPIHMHPLLVGQAEVLPGKKLHKGSNIMDHQDKTKMDLL